MIILIAPKFTGIDKNKVTIPRQLVGFKTINRLTSIQGIHKCRDFSPGRGNSHWKWDIVQIRTRRTIVIAVDTI
jgi:hypothetical protein